MNRGSSLLRVLNTSLAKELHQNRLEVQPRHRSQKKRIRTRGRDVCLSMPVRAVVSGPDRVVRRKEFVPELARHSSTERKKPR